MPDDLLALSSLDGRYARETEALREYFSEFATIRGRVRAEIAYLIALSKEAHLIRPLTPDEMGFLQSLVDRFSLDEAHQNKDFERITRHDVKAVESFLRARLAPTSLADMVEFLHFGLTSEDVNNIVQANALRDAREKVILPALDKLMEQLIHLARTHKSTPMLARTHGQPAVPTTFGKEMAVYYARLRKQREALSKHRFEAKLTGAVGNFNALTSAAPQVDWLAFSKRFVSGLGLEPNLVTTQILPYDNWITYFNILQQTNSILIDFVRDMWQYIGSGYLKLKINSSEAGSSTMPQKVNPIDFENGEGNLGIANALLQHYAQKMPISRLQRDLSDSTVRRTFGSALGHSLVAYASLARGLELVETDVAAMLSDLEAHWEVVAEGAQTILRAAGTDQPYEQLKTQTRGKVVTKESYQQWIDGLKVEEVVKSKLRELSPSTFVGLAKQIAEEALKN